MYWNVRFTKVGFRFALYHMKKAVQESLCFKADGGTAKSQFNITVSYDGLHSNRGYRLEGDFICLESDFRNSQKRTLVADGLDSIDEVMAKVEEFMKDINEEYQLHFDFYPTEEDDYIKFKKFDNNVDLLFYLENLLSNSIASSEYMAYAREVKEDILFTLFQNCIEPTLCKTFSNNTHKDNCAYWLAKDIDTGEIIRGYADRIRKELDDLGVLYKESK